jgi:FkbM family methyltransferase
MSNNKKRVFIDCGGFNGSSIRKFLNETSDSSEYDLITFEPNPTFYRCYSGFGTNHTLIPAAVWTKEGELEFFLDEIDGDGSSVLREKTTGCLNKQFPLLVPSIDFSNWLKENIKSSDEVCLKLDIEGAEYEVLEKMFSDGTIHLIKKLYIEWHWTKIPSVTKERHDQLVERLIAIGIVPSLWDANTREYVNG